MDRYPLPPHILKQILQYRPPAAPFSATIHITKHCNLRCEFCWHHSYLKRSKPRPYHVPASRIIKIIKELAKMGTQEISLSAQGEPSCHPDFADIVQSIKDSGMGLTIITNCTLYSPRIAAAYAKADNLMINLAAFDESSYQDIHAPKSSAKFNRVIDNIRLFARIYSRKGRPLITLGFVISKNTFRQIKNALAMARDCGVATVRFKNIDPAPHTKSIQLTPAERRELASAIPLLIKKDHGISHNLSEILLELSAYENKTPNNFGRCLVASLVIDIAEDGTVGLCCQNTKLRIGNWKKDTLKNIWSGSRARDLREQALRRIDFSSELWQACRFCSFARIAHYINRIQKRIPVKHG